MKCIWEGYFRGGERREKSFVLLTVSGAKS